MLRAAFTLMSDLEVLLVTWREMENTLRHIRTQVFIREQNVPEELEWEKEDHHAVHLLVKKKENYVATARLLHSCQIGRMAVLKPYRLSGIGSTMLYKLLSIAEDKCMKNIFLNAQIDAIPFYKKHGFKEEGITFYDAGIPHLRMYKTLS